MLQYTRITDLWPVTESASFIAVEGHIAATLIVIRNSEDTQEYLRLSGFHLPMLTVTLRICILIKTRCARPTVNGCCRYVRHFTILCRSHGLSLNRTIHHLRNRLERLFG